MNEEFKEIIEEMEQVIHKAKQKMGMRDGSYQGMGQRGGQRMGRMHGYPGGQHMGQAGGVYWGQQPQMGQQPMDDGWYDPRYM